MGELSSPGARGARLLRARLRGAELCVLDPGLREQPRHRAGERHPADAAAAQGAGAGVVRGVARLPGGVPPLRAAARRAAGAAGAEPRGGAGDPVRDLRQHVVHHAAVLRDAGGDHVPREPGDQLWAGGAAGEHVRCGVSCGGAVHEPWDLRPGVCGE